MKALLCAACIDIRALDPHGEWVGCRCGNMSARWEDPQRGTVLVRAKHPQLARILGMNNTFLVRALQLPMDEEPKVWRAIHEKATYAPGYVFDKNHRSCWACILRIGETGDVRLDIDPAPPTPKLGLEEAPLLDDDVTIKEEEGKL